MSLVEIRHFHLFAGLGGGAKGFNRGKARVGPRKANVLRGLAETQADFERAIGWLFLGGFIVAKGKTSGRLIARNGRRMAG